MRLLGVEKVEDLGMQHVSPTTSLCGFRLPQGPFLADTILLQINARALERDIYDGPSNIGLSLFAKLKARL